MEVRWGIYRDPYVAPRPRIVTPTIPSTTGTLSHTWDAEIVAAPSDVTQLLPLQGKKQPVPPTPSSRIIGTLEEVATQNASHLWDAVIVLDPNFEFQPIRGKAQTAQIKLPTSRIVTPPATVAAGGGGAQAGTIWFWMDAGGAPPPEEYDYFKRPLQGKPQPSLIQRAARISYGLTPLQSFAAWHTFDAVILRPEEFSRPRKGVKQSERIVSRPQIVTPPPPGVTNPTVTHTFDAVVQTTSTLTHTFDAVVQKTFTLTHTFDAVVVAGPVQFFPYKAEPQPPRVDRKSTIVYPTNQFEIPVLDQAGYRARNDDGDEATATWIAPENTPWSQVPDAKFRVRFVIDEIENHNPPAINRTIQYRRNGGTWLDVTGSSNVVRSGAASTFVANNTPTTRQLTSGSGTFAPGIVDTNNGSTLETDIGPGGISEDEFLIVVRDVDTNPGDVIELRVTNGGTSGNGTPLAFYSQIATLTVVSVPGQPLRARKPFENPTRLLTSRIVTVPFPIQVAGTLTHTFDAVVQTTLTGSHTFDAVVQKTFTASHTFDAVIIPPSTAVVKPGKPYESRSNLRTSRIITIPTPVLAAGTLQHTFDAVVQTTSTRTHTFDALIISPSSAVVKGYKPYESRVRLLGTRIVRVPFPILTIVQLTHTFDALIVKTSTRTHTFDAVVFKTLTRTHTFDAVVFKTLTRTHTFDAVVQKTFTRTHTFDAVARKTLTRTHTFDAVVFKTLTRTHTFDAIAAPPSFGTFTKTHTFDAYIYNPYPQWPTDDGTQWPTDDGSHWAGGSGGPQWPTATSSGDKIRNGTADNAGQVGFDTFYGSYVGTVNPGPTTAIVTDGGGPVFSLSQTVSTTQASPIACIGHRDTGYVVTPPGRWHWTFRIKSIRDNNMEYYIVWWDATLATQVELNMNGNEVLTPAQGWVQREFYFDLPSNAVHSQLNFRTNALLTTGECFRVDDIVLRQESQWRTTTSGGW